MEFPRDEVVRFVAAIVGQQDAEDVAQDVVVKLLTTDAEFRGESTRRTWMFAIAKHAALDHLKAKRSDPLSDTVELDDLWVPLICSPRQDMIDLVRAVDQLAFDDWKVIEARVMCPTGDEAAASLGCGTEVFKGRLRRVRAKLKKLMEVGDGEEVSRDVSA